jgi:hypothetical protein
MRICASSGLEMRLRTIREALGTGVHCYHAVTNHLNRMILCMSIMALEWKLDFRLILIENPT